MSQRRKETQNKQPCGWRLDEKRSIIEVLEKFRHRVSYSACLLVCGIAVVSLCCSSTSLTSLCIRCVPLAFLVSDVLCTAYVDMGAVADGYIVPIETTCNIILGFYPI